MNAVEEADTMEEAQSTSNVFVKELEDIDNLYIKIEEGIAALAEREDKDIAEIEAMIEAQAEVDTDVGTGGLDKIVERDDEGGGE